MSELAKVAFEEDGSRLDRWFKRRYPALTHGRLEKLLRTGQVRLDGKRAKASDHVAAGQSVRLPPQVIHDKVEEKQRPKPSPRASGNLQDAVLYMDKSVIVLNKPPGLATQGGSGLTQHVDGMLDQLSHIFYTVPVFGLVGFKQSILAPLAIEDFVEIMKAALVDGRLSRQTVAVNGPEKMTMVELIQRVGTVIGRTPVCLPAPVFLLYGLANTLEKLPQTPLVTVAQIRMLSDGFDAPGGRCQPLPDDLRPVTHFSEEQIRKGLPEPGPFKLHDLRFRSARI